MLLKPRHLVQARFPHARRPIHVRSAYPSAVVVPSRRYIGSCGIALLAELAASSKRLPEPRPHLAAGRIYEWPSLSVDRSRLCAHDL
jgi:hypothetical protein